MVKKSAILILFSFLSLFVVCNDGDAFSLSKRKVSINVVDDKGVPVEGAFVGIGFETGPGGREKSVQGFTDVNGDFTGSALSSWHIGGRVTKDGYYLSSFVYDFERVENKFGDLHSTVLRVVLRKKENPVPMFASDLMTSSIRVEIPVLEQKVGFDLIKFDWVAPYGQGETPDFIFYLKRSFKNKNDFDIEVRLSFASENDGIQMIKEGTAGGSLLRLPRFAPTDGYQKQLIKRKSRHQKERYVERHDDYREDSNYVFRIRSEADGNGNIEKAMYGKILGDIGIEPRGTQTLKVFFKYYLNPDYTRNLEYDPERNLFGSLPPLEQVGIQ